MYDQRSLALYCPYLKELMLSDGAIVPVPADVSASAGVSPVKLEPVEAWARREGVIPDFCTVTAFEAAA